MPGPQQRRRLHRLPVVILVVGTTVSVAAFVFSGRSVRHSDQLVLRQEATQASMVLAPLMGDVPAALAGLAKAPPPKGAQVAPWLADAAEVDVQSGYSGVAAVGIVGDRFEVLASTGLLRYQFGLPVDANGVAALRRGAGSYLVTVGTGAQRWLGRFVASSTSPAYAVYAESPITDAPVSLSALPGDPFYGIEGAIYAGRESPDTLVWRTSRRVRTVGERAAAVVPTASELATPGRLVSGSRPVSAPGQLIAVIWATTDLSGRAAASLPWILLVVGLVAAALIAVLFEKSERHRDSAVDRLRQLQLKDADLSRAQAMQERANARFAAMVRYSTDLTTVVSPAGEILYQSPSSASLLSLAPEGLLGRALVNFVHPDDRDLFAQILNQTAGRPGSQLSAAWRLIGSDGSAVEVDVRATNLLDNPSVAGIVLNSRDVSDRNRLEAELRHQAFHDRLTGLANRALFEDRLENALGRLSRGDGVLGVLFLDLDDFKTINDGRGHHVGDGLLVAVADRLAQGLRAGDTFARIGGDEFAVLVEAPEVDYVRATAERLLASLTEPFELATGTTTVRASIGIAVTAGLLSAQELLRDADIAMYAAKSAGKGRVEVFDTGLHEQVVSRLQLEVDLARALEADQLVLYYQPMVDVPSGEIIGVEALMRWVHPSRGIISPAEFIPVAESTGLIVPMGRWLLERACTDIGSLAGAFAAGGLHLSLNLSARQLTDPGLVHDVEAALRGSGLRPELLTLEITESVLMADPDQAVEVITALKRLGVKMSIDDFGTGYSSLGYLQRLPVDELKIDRTFIAAASESSDSVSLVQAIVGLAEEFGLRTVAEGIETPAQLDKVREAGCQLAQGFLFARPVVLDELDRLLVGRLRTGAGVG